MKESADAVPMIGVIGGSGLDSVAGLEIFDAQTVKTPFGNPSAEILIGKLGGKSIAFLARHGRGHTIPPHLINYRANLWALKNCGVSKVIAYAAVGGITGDYIPGTLAVPDQIIDYTWGREHTIIDAKAGNVVHIEFTEPYCNNLRRNLVDAANQGGIEVIEGGVYAVTQGPRLETKAEIVKLEKEGADIVGMTGMPEASLARELGLSYACVAIVVNPAAGKSNREISMDEIYQVLQNTTGTALSLLQYLNVD